MTVRRFKHIIIESLKKSGYYAEIRDIVLRHQTCSSVYFDGKYYAKSIDDIDKVFNAFLYGQIKTYVNRYYYGYDELIIYTAPALFGMSSVEFICNDYPRFNAIMTDVIPDILSTMKVIRSIKKQKAK